MWSWSGLALPDSSLRASWLRPASSVRVLEEHDVIGAPVHCTGVLGLDAFDELGLSRRAIVGAADAARFVSPNGTTVVIDAERVRAAVVDRSIFDRDLAASAVAAGARHPDRRARRRA